MADEVSDSKGGKEIAVKFVISDIVGKLSGNQPLKESLRSPANLESVEKSSFYLRLEKDLNVPQESTGVEGALVKKRKEPIFKKRFLKKKNENIDQKFSMYIFIC